MNARLVHRRVGATIVVALLLAACSTGGASSVSTSAEPSTTASIASTVTTSTPPTSTTSTTSSTTSTTSSTTTSSTTSSTTTSTSITPPTSEVPPPAPPPPAPAPAPPPAPTDPTSASYPQLAAAIAGLERRNLAVSVSVRRTGAEPFDRSWGSTNAGAPVAADTPFVIASASKLITALAIARLAEAGQLDVAAPVPWAAMGIAHHPAWDDVTPRELLDHTSGMPIVRESWLAVGQPCAAPLAFVMSAPPSATRGRWTYSNGNYCALGLLVEFLTGQPLDAATRALILDPAGVVGPYLARAGFTPESAPYPKGAQRLLGLGGAGEWVASSDALAAIVQSITPTDRDVMRFPGIIVDQYGWGHTGTLDGAKACAWVLDDGAMPQSAGATVLVGLVAGNNPDTGGGVCDRLVTALAADLGRSAGLPIRLPR